RDELDVDGPERLDEGPDRLEDRPLVSRPGGEVLRLRQRRGALVRLVHPPEPPSAPRTLPRRHHAILPGPTVRLEEGDKRVKHRLRQDQSLAGGAMQMRVRRRTARLYRCPVSPLIRSPRCCLKRRWVSLCWRSSRACVAGTVRGSAALRAANPKRSRGRS